MKTKNEHTPGPWVAEIRLAQATVTAENGDIVADIARDPQSTSEQTYDDTTIEANARLIAAAPELLAALDNCRSLLEHYEICYGKGPKLTNNIKAARSAIAKARGAS